MAFNIKQNDTSPSIRATLKDGSNAAVDLTGASVNFHMVSLEGVVVVNSAAVIVDPSTSGIKLRILMAKSKPSLMIPTSQYL